MKCSAYKVSGLKKGEKIMVLLPCPVWVGNGDAILTNASRRLGVDVSKSKFISEPVAVERKALRHGYFEIEKALNRKEAAMRKKADIAMDPFNGLKADKSMEGKKPVEAKEAVEAVEEKKDKEPKKDKSKKKGDK